MPDEHLLRVPRILAAEGVPQRFPGHVARGEPAGGPAMQVRDTVRAAPVQLPAQHLPEKAEEAVRRRLRLPRDQESIRALEVGQRLFSVITPGQRVDEPTTQAIRNRGAQQRFLDLGRLPDQHLVEQVVGDRRFLSPDLVDRLDGEGPRAHPAGGEAQGRRPALGPVPEVVDLVSGQDGAMPLDQLVDLGRGEREVRHPQLGQVAAEPPAVQDAGGVGAPAEHEADPIGRV
jgi:hypothetical protein